MGAVWMLCLYFPVRDLLDSSAAPALLGLGWIGLVAFAAAYLAGFVLGMRAGWRRPPTATRLLFLTAGLAGASTIPAIGWDAVSFVPFLMAYASYGLGRRWHWPVTIAGLVLATAQVVRAQLTGEAPAWVGFGVVVMMAAANTVNTWLIDSSVAADELRMQLATSEEREHVARDVHDLLGHSLTVVKLKSELAMRLVDRDPDAARRELAEISRLTGEAIAGVRATATGLRSSGLADQLQASRRALESGGIDLEVEGEAGSLSPAQALPAAWILREATTNILRHASAGRVRIVVEPGTILVEDDGIGIRGKPGNGLQGMAERASAAGAVLRIEPGGDVERGRAAKGTRVSLTW